MLTAENDASISNIFSMPESDEAEVGNYVTPIAPLLVATTRVIPAPTMSTPTLEFYKKNKLINPISKIFRTTSGHITTNTHKYVDRANYSLDNNITEMALDGIDFPFKIIHAESSLGNDRENWSSQSEDKNKAVILEPLKKTHTSINQATHSHLEKKLNIHPPVKSPQAKISHLFYNQEIQDLNGLDRKLNIPPYDPLRRIPITHLNHTNVFLPKRNKFTATENPNLNTVTNYPQLLFQTVITTTPNSLFIPVNDYKYNHDYNNLFKHIQSSINYDVNKIRHIPRVTQIKQVNVLKNKEISPVKMITNDYWNKGTKTHLLVKEPNPYETVLLRPSLNSGSDSSIRKLELTAGHKYSTLDLERLLSQMEVESEINKNLERSADNTKADAVAGQ